MNRILVISHLFPPNARAGAYRTWAMAKFLPRYGWDPIFLAPQVASRSHKGRTDDALLQAFSNHEVIRVNDGALFSNRNGGLTSKAMIRAYEWLLPPDSRVVWNMRLKRIFDRVIETHNPHVAVMTAPPFSTLLLGRHLKRRYGLKIVLDYRDAWTSNPSAQSTLPRRLFGPAFDRKALRSADLVTTASYVMADFIRESVGEAAVGKKFLGFPYGFDRAFFETEVLGKPTKADTNLIRATFAGAVHGELDVDAVLTGIRLAVDRHDGAKRRLRIDCYGTLFGYRGDAASLIAGHGLDRYVKMHPFLPYREFLGVLSSSAFLILPLGEFEIAHIFYPTKMFDYLGVRRPILYLGGEGGLWDAIQDCKAGICSHVSPEFVARSFISMVENYDRQGVWYTDEAAYDRFDRNLIYKEYCRLLDNLVQKPVRANAAA